MSDYGGSRTTASTAAAAWVVGKRRRLLQQERRRCRKTNVDTQLTRSPDSTAPSSTLLFRFFVVFIPVRAKAMRLPGRPRGRQAQRRCWGRRRMMIDGFWRIMNHRPQGRGSGVSVATAKTTMVIAVGGVREVVGCQISSCSSFLRRACDGRVGSYGRCKRRILRRRYDNRKRR